MTAKAVSKTLSQALSQVQQTLEKLNFERAAILNESRVMIYDMKLQVYREVPFLRKTDSRGYCLAAVTEMRQKYDSTGLRQMFLPRQQKLRKRIKSYEKIVNDLIRYCGSLLKRPDISDMDSSFVEKTIKGLLKDSKQQLIPRDDKTYDIIIKNIVEGHEGHMVHSLDKDLQEFILKDKHYTHEHLTKCYPYPEKAVRRCRCKSNVSRDPLPLEVASLIFQYSNLETCVDLRSVSSHWYASYQKCSHIFEPKVKERFPWFQLEAGLPTWADCALVFISRIRNRYRWTQVTDLNKLYLPPRFSPVVDLVAKPLLPNHTLPEGFTGLISHDELKCSGLCDKFHEQNGWVMNLNTYGYSLAPQDVITLVRAGASGTLILYMGLHITLPPKVFPLPPTQTDTCPITIKSHTVEVRCVEYSFVFPRNRLHYNYAWDYPSHHESMVLENTFVLKVCVSKGKDSYLFWNAQSNRPVIYAPDTISVPVASFNGLIWWVAKDKLIIPTFIDLHNPGVIYSRRTRVVSLKDPNEGLRKAQRQVMDNFRQCSRSLGAEQFIMRRSERGLLLVDLLAGTVTDIITDCVKGGSTYQHIYPGYEGHRFDAYYAHHSVPQ